MARVLLNRLIPTIAQENTPESQCGFRSNRGTVDMIFVLRQIQKKCRKQNVGLYAAFVHLTKAFDAVSRMNCGKSWRALAVPQNFSPSSASSMKVMSMVPLLDLNPHWLSGVISCAIIRMSLFSKTRAKMLPAVENRVMPR